MFKLSPSIVIAISFFLVIFAGGILLSLPIASQAGTSTNLLDAMFTSNSATCVTGLVVLDTGTHYSLFGLIVIIFLMQIGGLGYMTFSTVLMLVLRRKMFISEKLMIQEALNIYSTRDVLAVLKKIFTIVFSVEAIGALVLFLHWWPQMGYKQAFLYSIFHTVSAFCNAGFALPANYANLMPYVFDPIVNFTITSLIIIGGIGFVAISDVIEKRRLSLHSKTVIITTLCLIIGGTLAIYFTEGNNLQTIGGFSEPCKWMASYFQAVTPRTAGFNTIDIGKMHGSTLLFTIFLMFVGASPGGTGGGVKTTTFTIFIATIWATLKGWKDTVLFRRRIPYDTVRRAFMVISLGALWVCGAVFFLYYFDRDKTLLAILFEVVSAFGTVGLSTGITPYLSAAGKMIIMLVMFVGRVGPLTLLLALTLKQRESKIEYPKEGISIG